MKKISEIIYKNLAWKILSVCFAMLIWFIAMNDSNMTITEPYKVYITLLNEDYLVDSGYILANKKELESRYVTAYIRSTRRDKEFLENNPDKIVASIDLQPIDISYSKKVGEKTTANVNVIVGLSSAKLVSVSYSSVEIVLDKFVTREIEVDVNTINKPSTGYETLKPVVNPKTVKISGPKSVLDKVASVEVDIDLEDANYDIVQTKSPIAYDFNKTIITEQLNINTESIEVTVPVKKTKKVPINQPNRKGKVEDGYVITDVSYDPKFIQVLGSEEDINAFKGIDLEPIDVTGKNATETILVDLRKYLLDTNLSIVNGVSHEVTVTIKIEKEKILEIEVPASQIQIKGARDSVEINESSIKLVIKGTEKNLELLDTANIKCSLNLTDLENGVHDVPVDITLPMGIILVSDIPTVNVNISDSVNIPIDVEQ